MDRAVREEHAGNIQWFPGHMTKTLRLIAKEMKNVDAVVELLAARVPASSRNPEIAKLRDGKPSLLLLNKADLADRSLTDAWTAHYRSAGYGCRALSSKQRDAARRSLTALTELLGERRASRSGPIRAMVVGIPNVGKSTFINSLAGTAAARTEDRPGVTRGKQWVSAPGFELLDMPGVLWPKFEDRRSALLLAFTGAIRDDVLDTAEIAAALLEYLANTHPDALRERLRLTDLPESGADLLEAAARKRGMLLPGAEPDTERASRMVLDELRGGRFGRVTLEKPQTARE